MDAEAGVDRILGDPRRAIVTMAVPILVSLVVVEVNSLVDRAWCAGLGVEALAGISVVRPIYNVYVGLGTGIGVGAAAVIARNIGAGRPRDSSVCAVQSLLLALAFALAATPVLYILQPSLLHLIGTEDTFDATMGYMTCYTLGLTLIVTNGVVGGILNGQGSASLSTATMIILAVGNMVLDPLFIYGLDLGLQGASLATMAATAVSLAVGLWFVFGRWTFLTYGRSDARPDAVHMGAVAKAGVPQMLEYVVIYFMDAVMNVIVISVGGSEGLTIYSTPDAVVALMLLPSMAVGSALVTVASAAYGQRDPERMRESMLFATKLTMGIVLVPFLIAEAVPSEVLIPFTYSDDTEPLRGQMADALRIMAPYSFLFSMTPLCSGLLQAMRHPEYSVAIAIVRNLVIIGFYLVGAQFSLFAILYGLDAGHLVGALIIVAVAHRTFRGVKRDLSESRDVSVRGVRRPAHRDRREHGRKNGRPSKRGTTSRFPIIRKKSQMVGPMRFGLTTSRLSVGRSSQSKLRALVGIPRINRFHINVCDRRTTSARTGPEDGKSAFIVRERSSGHDRGVRGEDAADTQERVPASDRPAGRHSGLLHRAVALRLRPHGGQVGRRHRRHMRRRRGRRLRPAHRREGRGRRHHGQAGQEVHRPPRAGHRHQDRRHRRSPQLQRLGDQEGHLQDLRRQRNRHRDIDQVHRKEGADLHHREDGGAAPDREEPHQGGARMPGAFHWMRIQEFCYATEDEERVGEAFGALVGEEAEVDVDISEGEHGNRMQIFQCRLTRQKEYKDLFARLGDGIVSQILDEVEDRVDEDGMLYFRLDKQKAVQGTWELTHTGDSIAVTGKVAANPAKREVAVQVMRDFLGSLLQSPSQRATGRP